MKIALSTGARLGEIQSLRWDDLDLKKGLAQLRTSKSGERPFHFRPHWERAVKVAELGNFRFHDLRHSCASYLAMNGASLLEIADVLGHKTLAMVKRYSHLSTAHKQSLINGTFKSMVG